MNYLAHLYLSGNDEGLIIGNLIADYIKGKAYLNYPAGIQEGIILHRRIDYFTDSHPLVRESKGRIENLYGRYRGVITDMFYDHFLSSLWNRFSDEPLDDYAARIYHLVLLRKELLPEPSRRMVEFMSQQNWLKAYGTTEGLGRALSGMSRRWSLPVDLSGSINDLQINYIALQHDFLSFFPEIIDYCSMLRTKGIMNSLKDPA